MPERDPKDQARRLRQLADELDPPKDNSLSRADPKLVVLLRDYIEQHGPYGMAIALVEALQGM